MPRKKVAQTTLDSPRGVASFEEAEAWMANRRIDDIECIVPDQSGVARGKLMPAPKFFEGRVMSLPESIFYQTISGDYPDPTDLDALDPADGDVQLIPDFATLCIVPWEDEPTAQVIHDAVTRDGGYVELAPRHVLRRVIKLYEACGWQPMVAPELEFYLVRPNTDPDYPLEPPVGRSGRAETGRKSYSMSAVNEFDPLIDDIYDYSEAQGLEIDTLIHEEGAAQMEINLRHGRADRACRPGLPVQADDPRGSAEAQYLRDLHGQADRPGAGQRHAYPPVDHRYRDRPQHLLA